MIDARHAYSVSKAARDAFQEEEQRKLDELLAVVYREDLPVFMFESETRIVEAMKEGKFSFIMTMKNHGTRTDLAYQAYKDKVEAQGYTVSYFLNSLGHYIIEVSWQDAGPLPGFSVGL
jgi:hypothetical protein